MFLSDIISHLKDGTKFIIEVVDNGEVIESFSEMTGACIARYGEQRVLNKRMIGNALCLSVSY